MMIAEKQKNGKCLTLYLELKDGKQISSHNVEDYQLTSSPSGIPQYFKQKKYLFPGQRNCLKIIRKGSEFKKKRISFHVLAVGEIREASYPTLYVLFISSYMHLIFTIILP